ncbi:MAG: flagellar export chaperone FliS [Verrucomicrobiae bacterium]
MSLNPRAKIYQKAAVTSASPGQLVLMLLDGAVRFAGQAIEGLDNPDFIRAHEIANNNIIRTQAIVTELQGTLDFEKGGELAPILNRIYDYLLEQLREANVNKSKEPLQNVIRFVGEIRETWAQMLLTQGVEAA